MLGTAGAAIVTSGHEPVQGAQDQIQLIDQNVKVTSERGRGGDYLVIPSPESWVFWKPRNLAPCGETKGNTLRVACAASQCDEAKVRPSLPTGV